MVELHLDVVTAIALLCIVVYGFIWFMQILAIIYGKIRLNKPINKDTELLQPGVSITKPLASSSDPNLSYNLESFFQLDYPEFELLFCIQDESQTELINLVNSLMVKYSDVDAKIFIGAEKVGVNPKINNMIKSYNEAKYDLWMISDAGMAMEEDTLQDMVCAMHDDVGMVHQVPYICDGEGFSRVLEQVYFGTVHSRSYLSANAVGVNCATGMSCIMRKSLMDDAGGLIAFSPYIAEDFFIAKNCCDRGYKLNISSQTAHQNPSVTSVTNWQQRMIRWTTLRHAMLPTTIVFEPLSESIIIGPLVSWALSVIFHLNPFIFLPIHFTMWCIFDYILLRVVHGGPLSFSIFSYLRAWLLRECSCMFITLRALVSCGHLSWAGRKFKLRWGGRAEEVNGDTKDQMIIL